MDRIMATVAALVLPEHEGGGVRIYFHLTSAHDVIRDQEGVEISDLQDALIETTKAVEELQKADASAARNWSGWRLDVTDAAGRVLFSLDLDIADH